MSYIRKAVYTLLLTALVCILPTVAASAAEDDSVWVNLTEKSDGNGIDALVVTNQPVTDGVIAVKYDSSILEYAGIEVNEQYVAMHSVNAEEAGIVKISWVAPGVPEGTDTVLRLSFTGNAKDDSIEIVSGTVHVDGGDTIQVGTLDTGRLEEAIAKAEGLNASDYTDESYAKMKEALEAAQAVLAKPAATQSEVDAATETLLAAIDALVPKPADSQNGGTNTSDPSGTTNASDSQTGGGVKTGDESLPIMSAVFVVAAFALMGAALVVNKRRCRR